MLDKMRKERIFLENIWSKDTAYKPEKWTPEIPSTGHCYVTALYINLKYGGTIRWGKCGRFNHYWNELPNGLDIDLTSDQYGGSGLRPHPEILSRGIKEPNFNNRGFVRFMKRVTNHK